MLSHPPNGGSCHFQADHFPLSGSRLRGNNSHDSKGVSGLARWCLSLTAECRVTRLITKGDIHRCRSLAKGAGQSGQEMLEVTQSYPQLMEACGRELREQLLGSWC